MTGRLKTLAATFGAPAALVATIVLEPLPLYIWNASASVPIGLYRLRPAEPSMTCSVSAVASQFDPKFDIGVRANLAGGTLLTTWSVAPEASDAAGLPNRC